MEGRGPRVLRLLVRGLHGAGGRQEGQGDCGDQGEVRPAPGAERHAAAGPAPQRGVPAGLLHPHRLADYCFNYCFSNR